MNMTSMGSKAFMSYYIGISSMQQSEIASLAARQGTLSENSFVAILKERIEGVQENLKTANVGTEIEEEVYMQHLKEKYGSVRVESIGKDQKSLDKAGGAMMSGTDVVIAHNMLKNMVKDPKKASEIEGKIDYFFENIPKYKAEAAAMGLTFESCGCVVHEDGTVTYICGGGDPPERVAEVERINREKRAKEVAERNAYFEKCRAAADERRRLVEELQRKIEIDSCNRMQMYSGINTYFAISLF